MKTPSVLSVAAGLAVLGWFPRADAQWDTQAQGLTSSGSDGSVAGFQENISNDGSFSTGIPLELPAARGGKVTPAISLAYNTGWGDGWLGYGWKLVGTPYIEKHWMRRTPTSPYAIHSDGEYHDQEYLYCASGAAERLVADPPRSGYRQERERSYLLFKSIGSGTGAYWEATDALGTKYTFNARQVDAKGLPIRWYLSQVDDVHGNRATYAYVDTIRSNRQNDWTTSVCLSRVEWNFFAISGKTLPKHRLDVEYENRTDTTDSSRIETIYEAAHGVVSAIRLRVSAIGVYSANTNGSLEQYRRYALLYRTHPTNGRSLLASVQVHGAGATPQALPPTTFDYSSGPVQFAPTSSEARNQSSRSLPDHLSRSRPLTGGASPGEEEVGLLDVNGDGRTDWLRRVQIYATLGNTNSTGSHIFDGYLGSARNGIGDGRVFSDLQNFQALPGIENTVHPGFENLIDVNGDGLVDLVEAVPYVDGSPSPGGSSWSVHFGTGPALNFGPPRSWNVDEVITYLRRNGVQLAGSLPLRWTDSRVAGARKVTRTQAAVRDMNGDGIPDYVYAIPKANWWVFLGYIRTSSSGNVDGGFCAEPLHWKTPTTDLPISRTVSPSYADNTVSGPDVETTESLMDLNGDGLLDYCHGFDAIGASVYLNQGGGFDSVPWQVPGRMFLRPSGFTGVPAFQTQHVPVTLQFASRNGDSYQQFAFADLNRDGLPDRLVLDPAGSGELYVFYGQPNGLSTLRHSWIGSNTAGQWHSKVSRGGQLQRTLIDVTGDGLPDYVIASAGAWTVFENPGSPSGRPKPAGLLYQITNGVGGWLSIDYAPTTTMANTRLSGVRYVATRFNRGSGHHSGLWTPSTIGPITDISYENGLLRLNTSTNRWENRGFETVTQRALDPGNLRNAGPSTKTTYEMNDNIHTGAPVRVEHWTSNGQLFEISQTTWAHKIVGVVKIPYAAAQVTVIRDNGLTRSKSVRTESVDDFGNPLLTHDYGDDAIPDDDVWTEIVYAQPTSATPQVVGAPWRVTRYRKVQPQAVTVTTNPTLSQISTGGATPPPQPVYTTWGGATYQLSSSSLGDLIVATIATGTGSTATVSAQRMTVSQGGSQVQAQPTSVGLEQIQVLSRVILQYDEPTGRATDDTTAALPTPLVNRGNLKHVTEEVYDLSTGLRIESRLLRKYGYDAFGNRTRDITVMGLNRETLTTIGFDTTFTMFAMSATLGPLPATSTGFDYVRQVPLWTRDVNLNEVHFEYDSFGRRTWVRLSSKQGPMLEETGVDYPGNGIEVWVKKHHAVGDVIESRTRYDELGRKVWSRTKLGSDVGNREMVTEEIRYDGLGRPFAVKEAGQKNPDPGSEISPSRLAQFSLYDDHGRVSTIVSMPYDSRGPSPGILGDSSRNQFVQIFTQNLISEGLRTTTYDAHSTDVQNSRTPWTYTTEIRDLAGRVRKTIDEAGHAVQFEYDPLGNASKITRTLSYQGSTGVAVVIQAGFDSQGRRLWLRDPDRGDMSYNFDWTGNLLGVESHDLLNWQIATRITHQYDNLGRRTGTTGERLMNGTWVADPSVAVTYAYDNPVSGAPIAQRNLLGRISSMSDATGTTLYSYDEQGNVTDFAKKANVNSSKYLVTVNRTYSRQGRVQTETVNGVPVKLDFNSAGWLKRVQAKPVPTQQWWTTYWQANVRNEQGVPTSISRGMLEEVFTFDPINHRLTDKKVDFVPVVIQSTVLFDASYSQFDAIGNIGRIDDRRSGTVYAYTYDERYQLRDASTAGGTGQSFNFHYEYDSLGNLREETDRIRNATKRFSFRTDGKLPHAAIGINDGQGLKDISYELGNVTRIAPSAGDNSGSGTAPIKGDVVSPLSGTRTFAYDAMGRLVSAQRTGTTPSTSSYAYGGDSTRTSQSVNGSVKRVYVHPSVDLEIDRAGNIVVHQHLQGGTTLIRAPGGAVTERDYVTDHLGSVRATVDGTANGTNIQRTDYLPFGAIDTRTSTNPSPQFGYTGQEHDDASGLIFYKSRYYLPELNRFIQGDSIVPSPHANLSYNRFSYVANNPVNRIDPSGHAFVLDDLLFAAVVTGIMGALNGGFAVAAKPGADFGEILGGAILGFAVGAGSVLIGGLAAEGIGALLADEIPGYILGGALGGAFRGLGDAVLEQVAFDAVSLDQQLSAKMERPAFGWGKIAFGAASGGISGGIGRVAALAEGGGLSGNAALDPWLPWGLEVAAGAGLGAVGAAMEGNDPWAGALVGGVGAGIGGLGSAFGMGAKSWGERFVQAGLDATAIGASYTVASWVAGERKRDGGTLLGDSESIPRLGLGGNAAASYLSSLARSTLIGWRPLDIKVNW